MLALLIVHKDSGIRTEAVGSVHPGQGIVIPRYCVQENRSIFGVSGVGRESCRTDHE